MEKTRLFDGSWTGGRRKTECNKVPETADRNVDVVYSKSFVVGKVCSESAAEGTKNMTLAATR